MKIKIRIPRVHVIKQEKRGDLYVALGLVEDNEIITIEWSEGEKRCIGDIKLCREIMDKVYTGTVKIDYTNELTQLERRILTLICPIINNIVSKGSYTLTDIIRDVELDREVDPIILCLLGYGGIILALWKDPNNPVCIRIPVHDKYIVKDIEQVVEDKDFLELLEQLWSDSSSKRELVLTWSRDGVRLGLIKISTKPRDSEPVRTIGLMVEVEP